MVQRLWQLARTSLFAQQGMRFPALDGLRAISVLLIVGFHSESWLIFLDRKSMAKLPSSIHWLFFQSWVGVDVFFALSGFLIGRILFVELQRGKIAFKVFYLRRTLRIFPAYYLVLSLSVFFFARMDALRLLYEGTPWTTILWRSWANYLYVMNYVYDGSRVPNALSWGWSLCIEEHFYLILPALLTLLFRWGGRWARLIVAGVLVLAPLALRFIAFRRDPLETFIVPQLYAHSHTHADGLLFGVLIAYGFVYHHERFLRGVSYFGALLWVGGLSCFAAVYRWGGLFTPGLFAVVFQFLVLALGSSLLVINGLFLQNRATRVLAHPIWCPLARLSYGIYLVHMFAIFWVLKWWPQGVYGALGSLGSLCGFAATVTAAATLAAAVLFLAVERPMLALGVGLSRRYAPATSPALHRTTAAH